MKRRRSGFTMVELLVVITILAIVATMVLMVFRTGAGSDRMRSGARIVQSAFLGAKDRALHAKDLRGVRMTRDLNNANLVTGFVYLQPLALQSAQNITVARAGLQNNPPNTDATDLIIAAPTGAAWYAQDQSGIWPFLSVQVRIPSGTGAWYQLARQSTSPPYWIKQDQNNNQLYHLTLGASFQGGNSSPAPTAVDPVNTPSLASCDVQLGQEVLPFHQPIQMTAATVIDVLASSANVQSLAGVGSGGVPYIDIMFSSRGMVSGPIGAQGPLHFFLRDVQDALIPAVTVNNVNYSSGWIVGPVPAANVPADPNKGDRLIVTLFPQTGLVQTFEMDPTDVLTNGTNAGPPDGIADNPFNLAQQGKSAGR
jgi:prepilin-type N-terminal cleavage/methylation domain-containing protein